MVPPEAVERLLEQMEGALVLDEAYVDFAATHGLHLAQRQNVVVTRSMSKSYALAGIRFGFAVAQPDLIRELGKVKDSYNCDVLSLAAATAAVQDQEYLQHTRARIVATRERLAAALAALGFTVTPSQANFVWCRRSDRPVKTIYEELKRRMILVRYMFYDGYGDGLRISVGTDEEINRLLKELQALV
jgi:histidinol-phosphate aminotransferase